MVSSEMQKAFKHTVQQSEYGKSRETFARRRHKPRGGLGHAPPENFEILRLESKAPFLAFWDDYFCQECSVSCSLFL